MRRYFIMDLPNVNVIHALDVCIGLNETQRYSLDGTKLYIKTTPELITAKVNSGIGLSVLFPPGLTREYTIEEMKQLLEGPEWTNNEE